MIKILKNTWPLQLVNELHNTIDSSEKDSLVVQQKFEGRNLPLWPCVTPYDHTAIVLQILLISNNYYVSKKCIQTVHTNSYGQNDCYKITLYILCIYLDNYFLLHIQIGIPK